ncbi:MAG: GIY-YIG nuclease family protein [Burkholderiales bacterium]|nr:GIY-YIG nuclease family protein [Burkholderiales bacterium]
MTVPAGDVIAVPSELLKLGDLAFIDVETTGGRPLEDRTTEIAILRFAADGRVERWQSLLNPGVPIPAEIQALTGITNAMVRDAPSFFDVREDVRRLLEGAVFVAHNARFDYGFIKNEFRRQREPFTADVLCTVRLSRALYPAASGHGLDALISRHQLTGFNRHRAMGDTEATAAFVAAAAADRGAATVYAAARRLLRTPSLPPHLPEATLADIPDSPGVYLFYGVNDLPIYIGKAKHLRERIRGHFSSDHMTPNDIRLSQEMRRIEWQPTAGEFSALLLEAQLIKERMPLHNIALRRREKLGFFRLLDETATPPLAWVSAAAVQGASDDLFGPFSDKASAKKWLMYAAREHRLCDHALGFSKPRSVGEPCFARQVGRCFGVCEGVETPGKHRERLRAALTDHALPPWPFSGEVVYEERDPANDRCDLLRFDQWCALAGGARLPFDADVYRLLRRTIDRSPKRFRLIEHAESAAH